MRDKVLFIIFTAIIIGVFGYMFMLHGPLGMKGGDHSGTTHPESLMDGDAYDTPVV